MMVVLAHPIVNSLRVTMVAQIHRIVRINSPILTKVISNHTMVKITSSHTPVNPFNSHTLALPISIHNGASPSNLIQIRVSVAIALLHPIISPVSNPMAETATALHPPLIGHKIHLPRGTTIIRAQLSPNTIRIGTMEERVGALTRLKIAATQVKAGTLRVTGELHLAYRRKGPIHLQITLQPIMTPMIGISDNRPDDGPCRSR